MVDGVGYRWRVRQRPSYMQGAFAHTLNLGVELLEHPECTLLVVLGRPHPCNWLGDPTHPVKPSEVARQIAALDAGWQPSIPGKTFRIETEAGEDN